MNLDSNTAYIFLARLNMSYPNTSFIFRREKIEDNEVYLLEWSGGPLKSDIRPLLKNYAAYEEGGLLQLRRSDAEVKHEKKIFPLAIKVSIFGNPYTYYGIFESTSDAISHAFDTFPIESAVAWPL